MCSKTSPSQLNIKINNANIEQVQQFNYLRNKITKDDRNKADILCKMAQAKWLSKIKNTYWLPKLWPYRQEKCYALYALYGCEIWITSKVKINKLVVFEMWCYRTMLKMKWTKKKKIITNEAVLARIREKRKLWCYIKIKRDKMIGHLLLRHGSLTKSVIEGDVEGYIRRGKPRMKYMEQIIVDMGKNSCKKFKKLNYTREAWRTAAN